MNHLFSIACLAVAAFVGTPDQALAVGTNAVPRPIPETPFQPDLTPGYVLIEGDIQVPLNQFESLTSGDIHAAGTFGPATLWPGGVVPFEFALSGTGVVFPENQTAAIDAMNAISARAGVVFRRAVFGDGNRIRFQNSRFNSSPIGMRGGTQIINITSWDEQVVICHEIYHSLGFQHEQSRLDRGGFVTINLANICGSGVSTACTAGPAADQCCLCMDNAGNCVPCNFNFNTVASSTTYGPYDFDSFMHYGRTDFSCNGLDTITVNEPWNADWQDRIGNRDHFSYYDTINCRARYPFPNDRWLDRSHFGLPFGTFLDPFQSPILADTIAAVPGGGTLLVKYGSSYSAVGKHSKPVTIIAPIGDVFLGN